jgi:protein phosphatase
MEKIAIISDIHSNLTALEKTLEDIKQRGITRIFWLGDIISKGINSHKCIELVKENCEIVLQGNCDYSFSIDLPEDKQGQAYKWNKSLLTKEDINYLQSNQFTHEFYMSGSLIRLFHSTPVSSEDKVSSYDPLDKQYSMFLPNEKTESQNICDVVIYGHNHLQSLNKLFHKTLINSGSVGNALNLIGNSEYDGNANETAKANYLIVYGNYGKKEYDDALSFEFVSLRYDIEKELKMNKDNYNLIGYEEELKLGKYRNQAKLTEIINEKFSKK